jgi:Tol biopolymer transport system component
MIGARPFSVPLVLALALAALAASGPVSAHSDHHPPSNGRIAVQYGPFGGATDVLTVNPDGSDPRQLTHTAPEASSGAASWTADGKRILFQSDRTDGRPHVFSMKPDGSHVRQLTTGTGFEFQPAASPDGKQIAFAGAPGDLSAHGIWLAGKKGGSEYGKDFRQLTFPPPLVFGTSGFPIGGLDEDATFSPDGTRVAFLRILDSSPTVGQTAVFTVRVDGSDLRQLTPYSLNANDPHWSPDGKRLVLESNRDIATPFVREDIWVVDADGSHLTQITHAPEFNQYYEPDWSPDGTQIVFTHFSLPIGPVTRLEVIDADGSDMHTIWQSEPFFSGDHARWGTHTDR